MPQQRRQAEPSAAAYQDSISSTAGLASKVADVGATIPKFINSIDPSTAGRHATHFAKGVLKPVSAALTFEEARAGFRADVARGMSRDDAAVKNFGSAG